MQLKKRENKTGSFHCILQRCCYMGMCYLQGLGALGVGFTLYHLRTLKRTFRFNLEPFFHAVCMLVVGNLLKAADMS